MTAAAKAATTTTTTPSKPKRLANPKTPKSHISPKTPDKTLVSRRSSSRLDPNLKTRQESSGKVLTKRIYYFQVDYDGEEFETGDDVYVKRTDGDEKAGEDEDEDEVEDEVEECRVCYAYKKCVMLECEDCLGGFHLSCLVPPLRKVPRGEWICAFCKGRKMGKVVEYPKPPEGKVVKKTAKEKLLASQLFAARIVSLWKEKDGTFWANVCWYVIPEETNAGRQEHNLKREVYKTNHFQDIEMESIIRHCYVMNPKEYSKANDDGDDVFYCEYEYDICWHSFKRIADIKGSEADDGEAAGKDKDWNLSKEYVSDSEVDSEYEGESLMVSLVHRQKKLGCAANSHKGRVLGGQRVGINRISEHVRCHKQTELERTKGAVRLASLPKTLPCREKEMTEITAFVKGAISEDQCLGRCLYIHGVPGTGKTMSVHAVMEDLKFEVDSRRLKPYSFVEINCLKLSSPENIYKVIYEALTGHRVGWKKALHMLNSRFSERSNTSKNGDQPCVILIDELDVLVTRNQSVIYNILDWPTKLNSKLVIIGIANTMDLPEKLLPRISSRMGIQRQCFAPYNYQQLQEIIFCRLNGSNVFDKQAIEFASRKVAAISGDARRALEICRRAAELADYRLKMSKSEFSSDVAKDSNTGKCLVDMDDVEAAIQEMFQSPHIQVMRSCSKLSKIVLVAMVHVLCRTGMSEITFEKLAMSVSTLCSNNGEAVPGWDTVLKVSCKLGECKIIICEDASMHRLQKLQLNFPSDDVVFALKNCQEVPWLAKYL